MRKAHVARDGTQVAGRRKHRPRPTPKWLQTEELDAIARSRCLMVLSVLSGEVPVSEAIARAKISRGLYYQLETRALEAMLAGLNPRVQGKAPELAAAKARIEKLQRQLQRLQQEQRRTQRLLRLARKAFWAPVSTGRRGRPPKSRGSTPSGKLRLGVWTLKVSSREPSTPTKAGESNP